MSHGNLEKAEPNLTPMLDMVLQLVMFFMLCANFVMEQVNEAIKLPEAIAARPLDRRDERLLFLNVVGPPRPGHPEDPREGTVVLSKLDAEDSLQLTNKIQVAAFMQRRMKRDIAASPNKNAPVLSTIILRGDARCRFEKINDVLEAIRSAGYKQVRIRAQVGDAR